MLQERESEFRFFDPFETPSPWLFGVDQLAGHLRDAEGVGVHPWPPAFEEEECRRMGVMHADRARGEGLFGSTQRPVQEILLMAPLSVPFASLSRTSIAFGVLKAAFLPSAEELDALHLEEGPVQPVEVEGQEAGLLAFRHRSGVRHDLIEALRRLGEARLLEHGLVVEEQRLGDVEGEHEIPPS